MVLPALKRGGYSYRKQVLVGLRPGGGRHKVDLAAEKAGDEFLISMKWQQSSGTAEQKVPFEIICLAEAIRETSSYKRGYKEDGINSVIPDPAGRSENIT